MERLQSNLTMFSPSQSLRFSFYFLDSLIHLEFILYIDPASSFPDGYPVVPILFTI